MPILKCTKLSGFDGNKVWTVWVLLFIIIIIIIIITSANGKGLWFHLFVCLFVIDTHRFDIFDLTLKAGLGVTQNHWNRHGSIRHLWLPITESGIDCHMSYDSATHFRVSSLTWRHTTSAITWTISTSLSSRASDCIFNDEACTR